MNKLKLWWSNDNHKLATFGGIYSLLAIVNWLQITRLGNQVSNNFRIFSHAFWHLYNGQPLYIEYPAEHFDYFFYHPLFAFLFAPFAVVPEQVGIFLWLIFLTALFFKASIDMPFRQGFLWVFLVLVIFEFTKNLRHVQPNILNCALMLFVFLSLEKKQYALVGFLCALLFCIKGYGVIVGALCFFYPKWWKTIAFGVFFLCVLSALPLSITPFLILKQHYFDWINIVSSSTIVEPFCLMGFAEKTLHWQHSEGLILSFGLALMAIYWLLLIVRRPVLTLEQRILFLSFLFLWVVAFNRAAESPTYLYAVVGALILFHFSPTNKVWTIIFGLCFYVMTVLPSDLSPDFLKNMDKQYFLRPLFLLPLLLFAFFSEIHRFFQSQPKLT